MADPRRAAAAAPDLAWAPPRQFAQVLVEVMAGLRPQRQLAGLTSDRVRVQVRHLSPLLVSDCRPRISRVVVSRPSDRAVEMSVVVHLGPRSRALAVRLEHLEARPTKPGLPSRPAHWLCTAVESG